MAPVLNRKVGFEAAENKAWYVGPSWLGHPLAVHADRERQVNRESASYVFWGEARLGRMIDPKESLCLILKAWQLSCETSGQNVTQHDLSGGAKLDRALRLPEYNPNVQAMNQKSIKFFAYPRCESIGEPWTSNILQRYVPWTRPACDPSACGLSVDWHLFDQLGAQLCPCHLDWLDFFVKIHHFKWSEMWTHHVDSTHRVKVTKPLEIIKWLLQLLLCEQQAQKKLMFEYWILNTVFEMHEMTHRSCTAKTLSYFK